jgi:tRNA (mo5U34)-methyltransferase
LYPSKGEVEALASRNDFVWHQRFDLGHGVVAPGASDIGWLLQTAGVPDNLSGKSVLDIGTTNGGAAFLAERRGADPVVAVDICDDDWFGFRAIKEVLRSRVEFKRASIYDLPSLIHEQFDLVFFLGVLYHLRHPLLALDNVRLLTRQTAWIESAVADDQLGSGKDDPLTYFFRLNEFKSDGTNWFVPSVRCLRDWCQSSGLEPTRVTSWPESAPSRAVIETRPTEPEYRKVSYEQPLTVVVDSPDA